jgi:CDP-paratose 2-epimerase
MFIEFHNNPKKSAVYNAGGGRNNSISILEAIEKISLVAKKTPIINVNEENRIGDHQWYITNNSKFKEDYPNWNISHSIENLIEEMVFVAQKSNTR